MKSKVASTLAVSTLLAVGVVWSASHDCESTLYAVYTDYPGANIASCEVSPTHLDVFVLPEDSNVVNTSPWYGFRINPKPDTGPFELNIVLNYPKDFENLKHRYVPKLSTNGMDWEAIDPNAVTVVDEGLSARFTILVEDEPVFVSAQENLASDWYKEWFDELQMSWNIGEPRVVGYSHGYRPIEVFQTNPQTETHLLFLGRAHPPEIPGAMAMRAFLNDLSETRLEECSSGLSPICGFFARYNLVFIPLLNPDGVVFGHWRHNAGGLDLNRDWGNFTQPETAAVRSFLDEIDLSSRVRLMLDFHSTNRDVLYIQMESDPMDPENFISDWLDLVSVQAVDHNENGYPAGFEPAERELSDLGTSKNYFYRTYGIPSITFETGDNVDRDTLPERLSFFSQATIEFFVNEWSLDTQERGTPICRTVYDRREPCDDFYCFMIEANKATLVSSAEDSIISSAKVPLFATAILQDSAKATLDSDLRTSNYAVLEPRLIDLAGSEISALHIGRSRQDLHGTVRRMLARQDWLELLQQVLDARKGLLTIVAEHHETVVPTYTHGVPAEPTTYAHILLAYGESFERISERFQEGFSRVNQSPYGAGVGNTSGIRLDRNRLAKLLGFDDIVENSFDANFVSSLDYAVELASLLKNTALVVNQFVENIHSQQRNPWPWIWIQPTDIGDSRSTSMPQKRNPRDLDRLRTAANDVIAMADRVALNVHNVDAGMHDYRMANNVSNLVETGTIMLTKFQKLLTQIFIDPERAIQEIDRSFATSAQVTEVLVTHADLSFRDAFEFTAELVDLGRSTGNTIQELSDDAIFELYKEKIGEVEKLDLSVLRNALDAREMVLNRAGVGGPQPSETARMLEEQYKKLHNAMTWLKQTHASINIADITLQDIVFELCVDNKDEN
ncbi:MAG: hypothetical protein F4W92_06550 [Gammaproteobacteria bacterium]|nr:hypothetical protein [Gammaproteobacteria bacterium]